MRVACGASDCSPQPLGRVLRPGAATYSSSSSRGGHCVGGGARVCSARRTNSGSPGPLLGTSMDIGASSGSVCAVHCKATQHREQPAHQIQPDSSSRQPRSRQRPWELQLQLYSKCSHRVNLSGLPTLNARSQHRGRSLGMPPEAQRHWRETRPRRCPRPHQLRPRKWLRTCALSLRR